VYGHPDHRAVAGVGSVAARLTGAAAYRITVDRDRTGHLVRNAAAAADVLFGRAAEEITLAVTGSPENLVRKHAAISAHASQVAPEHLPLEGFAEAYGTEWYRHEGTHGALSLLGG